MSLSEKPKEIINKLKVNNSHLEQINIEKIIEENDVEDSCTISKDTGKRILTVFYCIGSQDEQ